MINGPANLNANLQTPRTYIDPVERTMINKEDKGKSLVVEIQDKNKANDENKMNDPDHRNQIQKDINSVFDALNTGLAMKYYEKSGEWYAVIENKLTREIVKEVPPKYIRDLQVKLKDMIGAFLDKKV